MTADQEDNVWMCADWCTPTFGPLLGFGDAWDLGATTRACRMCRTKEGGKAERQARLGMDVG